MTTEDTEPKVPSHRCDGQVGSRRERPRGQNMRVALVVVMVVLTSCQSPKGDTGPQGSKGDQGPAGATGPQGQTGVQGLAGNQGSTEPQGSDGTQGARGPGARRGSSGVELGPPPLPASRTTRSSMEAPPSSLWRPPLEARLRVSRGSCGRTRRCGFCRSSRCDRSPGTARTERFLRLDHGPHHLQLR